MTWEGEVSGGRGAVNQKLTINAGDLPSCNCKQSISLLQGAKIMTSMDALPLNTRTDLCQSPLYRCFLLNKLVRDGTAILTWSKSNEQEQTELADEARTVRQELENLMQLPAYQTSFKKIEGGRELLRCQQHHLFDSCCRKLMPVSAKVC